MQSIYWKFPVHKMEKPALKTVYADTVWVFICTKESFEQQNRGRKSRDTVSLIQGQWHQKLIDKESPFRMTRNIEIRLLQVIKNESYCKQQRHQQTRRQGFVGVIMLIIYIYHINQLNAKNNFYSENFM